MTAREVLEELGFRPDCEALIKYVSDQLEDEYVKRDGLPGTVSERQFECWENFCNVVKHERRFTFWNDPSDTHGYDIAPRNMVSHICECLQEAKLFRTISSETKLWRARVHDPGTNLNIPHDYCSVPTHLSQNANRMSPPGFSMFYGADTFETACVETVNLDDPESWKKCVSGLCFECLRPLRVFDLTAMECPRSKFEQWDWSHWEKNRFLRNFRSDLSKPTVKDGRHHIEYVPTQVLTEFIRWELRLENKPIDGIVYPSSINGGKCHVIFANHDQCLEQSFSEQLLTAVPETLQTTCASKVREWQNSS